MQNEENPHSALAWTPCSQQEKKSCPKETCWCTLKQQWQLTDGFKILSRDIDSNIVQDGDGGEETDHDDDDDDDDADTDADTDADDSNNENDNYKL